MKKNKHNSSKYQHDRISLIKYNWIHYYKFHHYNYFHLKQIMKLLHKKKQLTYSA